jgi:hypothetical protein
MAAGMIVVAAALILFQRRCPMTAKNCPVCYWEIKDGGIKVQVGDKEIVVCCDDCAKKARETPRK